MTQAIVVGTAAFALTIGYAVTSCMRLLAHVSTRVNDTRRCASCGK